MTDTPPGSASAEILCIGTELLLGEITNTNAQYLAAELAKLGIPHHFQTVVGDNVARIHQALTIAVNRSQLILVTGGLGPTPDDLTHEAIASFFQTPLTERPQIWGEIVRKYGQRGIHPSPSNRKQTYLPDGAGILPNPGGSACGLIWQPRPSITFLTFPGVPKEMYRMWEETAVPYLRAQGWGREIFHSHVLRHYGIPESTLAERVGSLLSNENPTVAPYAGQGEVRLRVTGRAGSIELAEQLMNPIIEQLKLVAGDDYYGSDNDTLASVTGLLLKEQGQTLAVAESCTGGLLGELLTGIPGSSNYFQGGVIAYDNQVKESLLKVDTGVLREHGAVSEPVAAQMAQGIRQLLQTDWALSITGVAGPGGGSELKPVGLVFIGMADPEGRVHVVERQFGQLRGREGIRLSSAQTALDLLRRQLVQRGNSPSSSN